MKIAVCCICRNEVNYIKEWIGFYKSVGFDSVYIYDNVSDDGTSELLINLDKLNIIKRVFWPRIEGIPPQRAAYSHFLDTYSTDYDYVLICDADEFLVVPDYNVKKFLFDAEKKNPNFSAIAIPWLIFGSSGNKSYENDLVINRFTKCDDNVSPVVKTLLNPHKTQNMRTHICDLLIGDYVNGSIELAQWHSNKPQWVMNNNETGAVLYHYYTKSEQEWIKRRTLPKADRAKIEKRNTTEFSLYSSQQRENLTAKKLAPYIQSFLAGLELQLDTANTNSNLANIKLCNVNNDWIFGIIENSGRGYEQVRFQFDNGTEIFKTVKVTEGVTPFSLKLKWKVRAFNILHYAIVGSEKSSQLAKSDYPSDIESFKLLCQFFSSAEEHIFSIFLRLLKVKPSLEILDLASTIKFEKYPLHKDFIDAIADFISNNNSFYLKEFLFENESYNELLSRIKDNYILNNIKGN